MDVLAELVKELMRIVDEHGNGSEAWKIYDGVGAWEVLWGYCTDERVLTLMRDGEYELYQELIRRWPEYDPW